MARFTLDIATPPENRTISSVPANDWASFVEPVTGLLQGDSIVQAAFTVKRTPTDSDSASTSVQRIIDGTNGSTGIISGNKLTFYFRPEDTAKMKDAHYFDVQVWVSRNSITYIRTIIKGRITAVDDITNATILLGAGVTLDIVGDLPLTGAPGDFFQLVGEVRDVGNNLLPYTPTWVSSNPLVASVDASGLVEFWSVGTCHITASVSAFGLSDFEVATSSDPSFLAATEGDVPTFRSGIWTPESPDLRYIKHGDVGGTANRITIGGTSAAPVVDISAAYVGQASITTLGTIGTGVWAGTVVAPIHGGTGFVAYVVGDVLYADTTTTLAKRNIGTAGQVLAVVGGVPNWHTIVSADVSDAASSATASKIVIRDVSGDFAAHVITGTSFVGPLAGLASSATILATARTISITGDLAYDSPAFNGSGNVTAAGTLATVNSNVGSFGGSTAIPLLTVNGKGLVTAVSTAVVVAPAGTVTGTTLAANVVTSSLTGVGTLVSLAVTGALSSGAHTASGNVIAGTDATYDWGAIGANRFRDGFLSRNLTIGGTFHAAGAVTFDAGLAVTSASAGATTATFNGAYSASGVVDLSVWNRATNAVSMRLRYDDSATNMRFGTASAHNWVIERGGGSIATVSDTAITVAISGMTNSVKVGQLSTSTTFGVLSFGSDDTNANRIGIAGGGGTDKNLYIDTPATGVFHFRNNIVDSLTISASAATFNNSVVSGIQRISTQNATVQTASASTTGVNIGFDHNTEIGWIQVTRNNNGELRELQLNNLGGRTTISGSQCIFAVAGTVQWTAYGAGAATFDGSGNITSVSDDRQKIVLGEYLGGLREVRRLRVVRTKFNELSGLDQENEYIQLLASNIGEVMPENVFAREHFERVLDVDSGQMVNGKSIGHVLSIWDRGIIGVTINAVKDLAVITDDHELRIVALEKELAELKAGR